MIRRLRWKVVAVTMAVVTAVLLGAMTTVFLASRASLESQSREQLRQALQGDAFAPGAPDRAAGRTFVAEVFAGGTVRVSESVFQDLGDEETVLAVINDCLARQEDSGLLPDYDLHRLCRQHYGAHHPAEHAGHGCAGGRGGVFGSAGTELSALRLRHPPGE